MIRCLKACPKLRDYLEVVFLHTSHNSLTEFIDEDGIRKLWISIGKYWPDLWLNYITNFNQNIIECRINWILRCPDKDELKQEACEWDKTSFLLYRDLSEVSDYSEILSGYNNLFRKDSEIEFRLYYLFEGKQLQLSRRGYFDFPIIHRYEPRIKTTAKPLKKQLKLYDFGTKYINTEKQFFHERLLYDEALWEMKMKVLDLAKKYKESEKNPFPSGYIKGKTQFAWKDEYQRHATRSLPAYCDPYCKKQKDYENKLPCKFETIEGYCKDPARSEKKKKMKLKMHIEHSGDSLDDFIPSGDFESNYPRWIDKLKAPQEDLDEKILRKEILKHKRG